MNRAAYPWRFFVQTQPADWAAEAWFFFGSILDKGSGDDLCLFLDYTLYDDVDYDVAVA